MSTEKKDTSAFTIKMSLEEKLIKKLSEFYLSKDSYSVTAKDIIEEIIKPLCKEAFEAGQNFENYLSEESEDKVYQPPLSKHEWIINNLK